jgi:fatty acid desaturase
MPARCTHGFARCAIIGRSVDQGRAVDSLFIRARDLATRPARSLGYIDDFMSLGLDSAPAERTRVARIARKTLGEESRLALLAVAADEAPARFTAEHRRAVPGQLTKALDALRGGDNWHSVIYIGLDWAVVVAALIVVLLLPYGPKAFGLSLVAYPIAVALIGSRQRALMNLVHQSSHDLLFKRRALNRWVGEIFLALPLLTTIPSYTSEHRMHHGWLWSSQRDPKTERYRTLGLIRPADEGHFVRRHIVRPMFLRHVPFNVVHAVWKRNESTRQLALRIVFWAAVTAPAVALGVELYVLLFWIVPLLTSFQIIRYFAEMAEHAGLKTTNPWLATRSWTSSRPVRAFLAPHSDHFHLAHHLWPRIPHYRLAQAHRIAMQIPQYAAGHHCDGFFVARTKNVPSVVGDILSREAASPLRSPAEHRFRPG